MVYPPMPAAAPLPARSEGFASHPHLLAGAGSRRGDRCSPSGTSRPRSSATRWCTSSFRRISPWFFGGLREACALAAAGIGKCTRGTAGSLSRVCTSYPLQSASLPPASRAPSSRLAGRSRWPLRSSCSCPGACALAVHVVPGDLRPLHVQRLRQVVLPVVLLLRGDLRLPGGTRPSRWAPTKALVPVGHDQAGRYRRKPWPRR